MVWSSGSSLDLVVVNGELRVSLPARSAEIKHRCLEIARSSHDRTYGRPRRQVPSDARQESPKDSQLGITDVREDSEGSQAPEVRRGSNVGGDATNCVPILVKCPL